MEIISSAANSLFSAKYVIDAKYAEYCLDMLKENKYSRNTCKNINKVRKFVEKH